MLYFCGIINQLKIGNMELHPAVYKFVTLFKSNLNSKLEVTISWCLNTIERSSIYKGFNGVPMLLDCEKTKQSNFETQIDRLISERKAQRLSVSKLQNAKEFIMKINELSDMKFYFKQF